MKSPFQLPEKIPGTLSKKPSRISKKSVLLNTLNTKPQKISNEPAPNEWELLQLRLARRNKKNLPPPKKSFPILPILKVSAVLVCLLLLIVAPLSFTPQILPSYVLNSFAISDVVVKQMSSAVVTRPTNFTMLVKRSSITPQHHFLKVPMGVKTIILKSITQKQADQIISKAPASVEGSLGLVQKAKIALTIPKVPKVVREIGATTSDTTLNSFSNIFETIKDFFLKSVGSTNAGADDTPAPSDNPAPDTSTTPNRYYERSI
jgi:hypothetical protein